MMARKIPLPWGLSAYQYICVLSALGFSLPLELIFDTNQTSIDWNIDIKDMLAGELYVRIAEREAERRSSRSNV